MHIYSCYTSTHPSLGNLNLLMWISQQQFSWPMSTARHGVLDPLCWYQSLRFSASSSTKSMSFSLVTFGITTTCAKFRSHASCHLRTNVSSFGLSNTTVVLSAFQDALTSICLRSTSRYCAFLKHIWTSFRIPLYPFLLSAYQRKIGAWPLRLPVMVASLEAMYSISVDRTSACSNLVITTPQGIGQPKNLCPEILIEPIGFLNDSLGA